MRAANFRAIAVGCSCLVAVLAVFLALGVRDPVAGINGEKAKPVLARSIGIVPIDCTIVVRFDLVNRSDVPMDVVGSTSLCDEKGCLKAVNLPLRIQANGSATIDLECSAHQVGTFDRAISLYTSSNLSPEIRLRVNGVTVEGGQ